MKGLLALIQALVMLFGINICGTTTGDDAFTVNVVCESDGIYQIYYSCYFDDEYYGMGGLADYDGNELTPDTELAPKFTKAYFDGREDVSTFSIDFSPYGKDDTSEIGTTNRVYIAAEYGQSYVVVLSRNLKNKKARMVNFLPFRVDRISYLQERIYE